MTVVTTRPDATVDSSGFSNTGGSSRHGATNDDSDATYIASGTPYDYAELGCGEPSIPAGGVVKRMDLRMRCVKVSGNPKLLLKLFPDGNANHALQAYVDVTWTAITTITALGGAPAGDPSDVSLVALLQTGSIRVHELYVDTTYVAKPVTAPSAPTGTITTTNRPTVEWANTLDADGGAQSFYQVRVFTAAQYGAGGFDPATSTATVESDTLHVAIDPDDQAWTPTTPLADATYRAYVRVAQTVNGELHWSDWAYTGFVVDVDLPATPAITATAVDGDGAIMVDVDHQAGTATTTHLELQRSLDAGATWEAMRLTTDTDGVITGLDTTVFDLEAPNGTLMTYRARAGHDYGAGEIAWSAWASDTATWQSTAWWLKAPEQPDLNMVVVPNGVPGYQRPARQGVFQALGSSDTVIISDKRGAARGTLKLQIDTATEGDDLDALLDSGLTLLLQGPPEHHWPDRYLRFGDQDRSRWIDKAWVGEQIDTLSWYEVPAPTGTIDDWPAGGS